MLYQTRLIHQGEKTFRYYKSPAGKLNINLDDFPIIRKSSHVNQSLATQKLKKTFKGIFNITTAGTIILAAIALTIIILFAFYGNGRFIANPIIG